MKHMKTVDSRTSIIHIRLLGHSGYGVTELRTFDNRPMVASADSEQSVVRLCEQADGRATGIFVGLQPRPVHLFDRAPNCWMPATLKPEPNCACNRDIEFVTVGYWDLDTVSAQQDRGYPASEAELEGNYEAARLLSRQDGLALSSSICCSGSGYHVLAPLVPIPVDDDDVALKFRCFCWQLASGISGRIEGVRFDEVFNLGRVTRLMDTVNRKGRATAERPHRRASFVTGPVSARSMALHHMILGTEIPAFPAKETRTRDSIRCDVGRREDSQGRNGQVLFNKL